MTTQTLYTVYICLYTVQFIGILQGGLASAVTCLHSATGVHFQRSLLFSSPRPNQSRTFLNGRPRVSPAPSLLSLGALSPPNRESRRRLKGFGFNPSGSDRHRFLKNADGGRELCGPTVCSGGFLTRAGKLPRFPLVCPLAVPLSLTGSVGLIRVKCTFPQSGGDSADVHALPKVKGQLFSFLSQPRSSVPGFSLMGSSPEECIFCLAISTK